MTEPRARPSWADEPLTVVCFKWKPPGGYRSTFDAEAVNTLAAMVARHYQRPHRVICVTDDAEGIHQDVGIVPLWDDFARVPSPHGPGNPSCYRRLRMFSAEAGQIFGPRFVSLDLDCVITGDLRPIFDRPEDIVLWGDTHPTTYYNGSLILQAAGARRQVWDLFDPVQSPRLALQAQQFGSDQGWIGACLGPHEAKFTQADGVYSYRNHIRRHADRLPKDARLVVFHGHVDPWDQKAQRLAWVREHYR